jgi:hypothetical protein
MRLFNTDQHISVIADLKTIFEKLGHQVDDWCQSCHAHVLGKTKQTVKYIGTDVSDMNVLKFYNFYKDQLSKYDAFIAAHPNVFMRFYLPFGKPIIVVATTRFDCGLNPGNAEILAAHIRVLQDEDKRVPRRVWFAANNKSDRDYLKYYTGIDSVWIPSLCEYVGVQHDPASASDRVALFAHGGDLGEPHTKPMPGGYSWSDLYKCKAVCHLPYNTSTMTLFENYTANMPIFFPDRVFLKEHSWPKAPFKLFSQLSFHRVHSQPDPKDFPGPVDWWIDRSDALDPENMPHVILFSSLEDYAEKVKSTDYAAVSAKMREFNKTRQQRVYDAWSSILGEIAASIGQPVPPVAAAAADLVTPAAAASDCSGLGLWIGLAVLLVVVFAIVLFWWWKKRTPVAESEIEE